MLEIIGTILQVIFFIFKNKFEKDEKKKKENDALSKQAGEAIKSRDASALNAILIKLRH
jgi:hypothetical protein